MKNYDKLNAAFNRLAIYAKELEKRDNYNNQDSEVDKIISEINNDSEKYSGVINVKFYYFKDDTAAKHMTVDVFEKLIKMKSLEKLPIKYTFIPMEYLGILKEFHKIKTKNTFNVDFIIVKDINDNSSVLVFETKTEELFEIHI